MCQCSKRRQLNQGKRPVFKKVIHTIEDRGNDDVDEILTIGTIEVNAMGDTRHSMYDTRDKDFARLEIAARKDEEN